MKSLTLLASAGMFLATSIISTSALADNTMYNSSMATGSPYVGIKAGKYDIDVKNSKYEIDNPIAYGLYGGYQLDNQFGVEVDYTLSDNMDIELEDGTKNDSLKGSSMGIYGTYRYHIPTVNGIYLKGKLGVAQSKVETDINQVKTEFKDTGVSAGAGVGFAINDNLSIEGEYHYLPEASKNVDSNLLSVGAHFKF